MFSVTDCDGFEGLKGQKLLSASTNFYELREPKLLNCVGQFLFLKIKLNIPIEPKILRFNFKNSYCRNILLFIFAVIVLSSNNFFNSIKTFFIPESLCWGYLIWSIQSSECGWWMALNRWSDVYLNSGIEENDIRIQ